MRKRKSITVRQIVKEYLIKNGYDGLYDENCGCPVDDLAPCDTCIYDCRPGHKVPCDPETCPADGKCEHHIGNKKLDELAKSQKVKPITNVRKLFGTWPGKDDDKFEESVSKQRKGKNDERMA